MRSAAATLRGRYLASWRYGADTDALVEAALARDQWSESQWKMYREEQLAKLLHRAAYHVPYYREQWTARRARGDRSSPEYLENWPVLEKEPVRASPRSFLADECRPASMFREHTSGTSGTSLDLWWSRQTVREWYALFEARWRRWYGVSREMRWAILGGQLVKPADERQPPFWVKNGALNQLYMSSYHLAPDLIPSYLDALRDFEPSYLFGYTSAVYTLALEMLRLGRNDLSLKVVITNAEPLLDWQRDVISAAFQCPVRETYGMAEIVAAAGECEAGQMHLWPETGIVEVLDESGDPVEAGITGDLVCTGLLNADMPLVRYRIGDRGALSPSTAVCTCKRTLPRLASIEGRIDDVVYTTDGRPVGRLDPVFKGGLPIREAQIVQETLNRLRVVYVPGPDFEPSALDSISARLRARLGPIQVVFESTTAIPRTSSGKFKAVVSELGRNERDRRRQAQQAHSAPAGAA